MNELLTERMAELRDSDRRVTAAHADMVAAARPRRGLRGLLSRYAARSAAMQDSDTGSAPAILSTAIRREAR